LPNLTDTNVRDGKVTSGTLVPLGNLLVLIAIATGGAMWATRIDGRVGNIESSVATLVDGTWTQADQENWADLLRALNPSLNVPAIPRRRKP
jgi:hypothetical protein